MGEPLVCSFPLSPVHNLKTHHAIVTSHSLILAHLRLGLQNESCSLSGLISHIFPPLPHAFYVLFLSSSGWSPKYLSSNRKSYERNSFHTHGHVGIPEVSFGALNAVFLVNMAVTDF